MNQQLKEAFNGTDKVSSLINNPFKVSCIGDIDLHSCLKLISKERYHYATVEFTNGNTKGIQRIDGDSLPDLLLKVYEFCNSLG